MDFELSAEQRLVRETARAFTGSAILRWGTEEQTMGNHARLALIFAQTDPELGHRGLGCFLIDTDQPGFQAHARMLVWRAGFLKDRGKPNTTETSIAKLYATEAAFRCANTAIQVHGGSGYVDDYPVERYLRDVRVTTLYEGTSQIQKLIIGRALTGINALVAA
jgi:alkylation response protein AidB-like acyl-CoA dehydrogenase